MTLFAFAYELRAAVRLFRLQADCKLLSPTWRSSVLQLQADSEVYCCMLFFALEHFVSVCLSLLWSISWLIVAAAG
jgi:hypothetical protein